MSRRSKKKNHSDSGVQIVNPNKGQRRIDSFQHIPSGKGVQGQDKLADIRPNPLHIPPGESRLWYMSNGFITNIIDAPAIDATREWIDLETNRDDELNISRLIQNRLTELNLRGRIKDLIRFSRMHSNGGLMFWGIKADVPQTDVELAKPMPDYIQCLDFINVIEADRFTLNQGSWDPLSRNYHRPSVSVGGAKLHPSRVHWSAYNYIPEAQRGFSVLETILEGIFAQDTALWSATTTLMELNVKVWESDMIDSTNPKDLIKFLKLMKKSISTQSMVGVGKGEQLTRLQNSGMSDASLDTLFNFVFENLAGLAKMPKSKILGQAQGAIESGQYDLRNYYDDISKFQELEIRPIIEKAIKLVIHETSGEIYRKLGADVESLDWEFSFKSLWKPTPLEEAQIKLYRAQANQIYITTTVLSPQQVQKMEYAELEEFSEWENEPEDYTTKANFQTPEIPPLTDIGGKKGEKEKVSQNEKTRQSA